jgi:nascent polypeptide-associated complex subunit alpha
VEGKPAVPERVGIPESDIELVAQQANVTAEEARKALENSEGDLAKAIVSLKK